MVSKRDDKHAELTRAVEEAQSRVKLSLEFASLANQIVEKAAFVTAQVGIFYIHHEYGELSVNPMVAFHFMYILNTYVEI